MAKKIWHSDEALRNLAAAWAAVPINCADPYCYARTLLHLRGGLLDFAELQKDVERLASKG